MDFKHVRQGDERSLGAETMEEAHVMESLQTVEDPELDILVHPGLSQTRFASTSRGAAC